MSDLILHNYFRSSTSTRVRVALGLKGLAYDYVSWNLRDNAHLSDAYLKINAQGVVPALIVDGHVLTQSIAIIEYLDELFPEPALLPGRAEDRARIRSLAAMIACEIHPLNNLRVLRHLETMFQANSEAQAKWFEHWVHATFKPLEHALSSDDRTGRFCHGDSPGLADICLFSQVLNNRRFEISLTGYPTIERIHNACLELEPFSSATPEKQIDAV